MGVFFADLAGEVEVPPNGTLSRVVHQDDRMRVVVFAFDAGQELTEHKSGSAAVVQVLEGRISFQAGGNDYDMGKGAWLTMAPGETHALQAVKPSIMVLTLLRGKE
jgi:quercetin dioxygenase-like cupin family protein